MMVGVADEVVQIFLPTRYFDIEDILINIQGCLFVAAFSFVLKKDGASKQQDNSS